MATLLRGKVATLKARKLQHKDDGIPEVLCGIDQLITIIEPYLPQANGANGNGLGNGEPSQEHLYAKVSKGF